MRIERWAVTLKIRLNAFFQRFQFFIEFCKLVSEEADKVSEEADKSKTDVRNPVSLLKFQTCINIKSFVLKFFGFVKLHQTFLQRLVFLIRDWEFFDEHPFGHAGGESYIQQILKVRFEFIRNKKHCMPVSNRIFLFHIIKLVINFTVFSYFTF